ncbi:hypothetical protein MCUN1_002599 [Malassezia cuniculi]|uniref:VHS domain-containing protein n=1 Tax=Malassezia cuniculi TaxID=948313 RepID=A0AAF0F014_9BASI|nr:hypothetical protein MCUN1_002599 [Malassezia cuniculi]
MLEAAVKRTGSIGATIAELCSSKYPETSYDHIDELVETISRNAHSAAEVSRAIRKALKNEDPHVQKRALTVLEALVEFSSREFQTTFLDDKLHTRIRYLALSEPTPPGVRRKLMLILLSWHRHFMRDPDMTVVARLYVECGGVERVPEVGHIHGEPINATAPAITVTQAPAPRRDLPSLVSHRLSTANAELTSVSGTIKFAEKNANELLEAITSARGGTDILLDDRVRMLVNSLLSEQKRVVSYIHVVQDEEFLAKLVDTNDKIIDVLNRLQLAAAGGEVKTHPLGTINEDDEADVAVQAFRRLSVQDNSVPPNVLSVEVDQAIVTNSGFATAAPSRGATVDDYNSDESEADDIDIDAAKRNTVALQGTSSGTVQVPASIPPSESSLPHASSALAPSLSEKLHMLGPAAAKPA